MLSVVQYEQRNGNQWQRWSLIFSQTANWYWSIQIFLFKLTQFQMYSYCNHLLKYLQTNKLNTTKHQADHPLIHKVKIRQRQGAGEGFIHLLTRHMWHTHKKENTHSGRTIGTKKKQNQQKTGVNADFKIKQETWTKRSWHYAWKQFIIY